MKRLLILIVVVAFRTALTAEPPAVIHGPTTATNGIVVALALAAIFDASANAGAAGTLEMDCAAVGTRSEHAAADILGVLL